MSELLSTFEFQNAGRGNKISLLLGGWCAMCWVVHFSAHALFDWLNGSSIDERFRKRKATHIANRAVSCLNGVTLGSLATHVVLINGAFSSDTFNTYPESADTIFSLMLGYHLYDSGALLLGGGDHWSMYIHHVVALVGAAVEMTYQQGCFYPLAFSITEITTPTTNIYFWLKSFDLQDRFPNLWRANLVACVVLFWTIRVLVGPLVVYYAYSLGQLSWVYTRATSPIVTALITFNVLALSALNTSWAFALTKICSRSLFPRKRVATSDKELPSCPPSKTPTSVS